MIVRSATLADNDDAVFLYKELVGTLPVADGDTGRIKWAELLNHPGTTVFCVEQQERLIGMTTLHVLPNLTFGGRSYALIENVVTAKAKRGKGVGRQLMEHTIQAAWAAGVYKIMLLTGKQTTAKEFYQKLGFSDEEKHGMTIRRAPKRDF